MTNREHLVEQHIVAYESRLKHIDELLEKAQTEASEIPSDVDRQLKEIADNREKLARELDTLRLKSVKDWKTEEIEKAGPMGVWDAVAQQLEKVVERIEGRRK